MPAGTRRISIGFQGGQVLALRVADEQLKGLYDALGGGGWHEVESEDGFSSKDRQSAQIR